MVYIKLDNGSVCLQSGSSSVSQEILPISWNAIVRQRPYPVIVEPNTFLQGSGSGGCDTE